MTYIAHLDPNSIENERARAHAEAWDAECPEWRELSLDPEDRDLIPEDLVSEVSEQDRARLRAVLDWEAFGGFRNP